MAKYIDADLLIRKIRGQIRWENLNFAALGGGGQTFCINTLEWVLKQIDSLQQKQPEEPVPNDLEEAANEYVKDIPTFKDSCLMKAAFEDGWLSCKEQMMKEAVKWLVDDDYHELTEKGRFILGSVGIGYNGHYIPYSDLLKLPKED